MKKNRRFLVSKNDITSFKTDLIDLPTISDNQILVKIDRYAFTSNNVTYAAIGHQIGYWNFFPVDHEYGLVPVWGFADIIESTHPDIENGSRIYGYFPMAEYLVISPAKVSKEGFFDGVEHRRSLPPVYNNYVFTNSDRSYDPAYEEIQALIRPLFLTAFLLEDYFSEAEFFGAEQIILTSASSKTAMALAYQLKQNQQFKIKSIGLTGSGNVDFVRSTDYYDEVLYYRDLDKMNQKKTLVVDFRGSSVVLSALNSSLNENIVHCTLVGLVDWQTYNPTIEAIKGAKFFFAPDQAQKKIKEWGQSKFLEKVGVAMKIYFNAIKKNIKIEKVVNMDQLETLYSDMVGGRVDPRSGNIIELK